MHHITSISQNANKVSTALDPTFLMNFNGLNAYI